MAKCNILVHEESLQARVHVLPFNIPSLSSYYERLLKVLTKFSSATGECLRSCWVLRRVRMWLPRLLLGGPSL
jgi:hypothetical protein